MAQPNRSISFFVVATVAAVVAVAAVDGLAGLAAAVQKKCGWGGRNISFYFLLFFSFFLPLLSHVRARPELDRRQRQKKILVFF